MRLKHFVSMFFMLFALSVGAWGQAAVNTVLFSENFGGYSNNGVPSGSVSAQSGKRVIYGSGSPTVTYTSVNGQGTSPGTTKVQAENLAGGTSPELMVGKKGSGTGAAGGSFSIAGIPNGGAQVITVSYKQNAKTLKATITGTGYSTTFTSSNTSGTTSFDVTVSSTAAATFTLTLQATTTNNVRVDDISIIVKTAGSGSGGGETPSCTEPATALSITNANAVTLGSTLELTTTGGNGGTVTWSVVAGTGTASVSGNTLTPSTKGTVTVTATQDDNEGKCGAAPTQTITISKPAPDAIDGGVVDELTSATFGVTTGSYTAFTNQSASNTGHSAAVYAGTVARNGNGTHYNIQLNSGQTSGKLREIATTTSGGLAKRVYVTWATQSTNTDERKLTVYGQNDAAYTGSETAATGTKIGDIVYASGDVFEYLDITGNYKYIQIVASAAIYMDQIDITWLPIKSAITIDDDVENGSVDVSGIVNLSEVAAGTEVTLTNAPASGYKLTAYDVYKTGASATKVTVTNGKFTMPDYAVTVSASFEATKTLSSITLSGTYPTVFLTGDAFSHEGMTVTANYDDNTQADVTSNASFTGYNMSSASAQTVTVSYTEGTTKTQTYGITVKDAYTVPEILPLVPATGTLATKVKGYISHIDEVSTQHGNATYYISADGSRTNELEVYRGKNVGNTAFTSEDDIEVGDFVTITGNVKTFSNTKEFDAGNYIVSRTPKGAVTTVTVSGTPTKTEYAANETFDPAGLVVTATYANGFSTVVTEGITWGNDLTDGKVTENTTVHVTATVSGITNSPAHDVVVTVAAKTLLSIAVGTGAYTIYTGEALPQPTVTATFSEGEPEDVSAQVTYDSESVFSTATIDNPDPQMITVSYTFGGETKTATYTVSVKDYENADNAPYSVTEALHIITAAIGNTESAREIVVTGTVSEENISNNKNRYKISDSTNELLVYAGKGFNNENFTNTNYPKVGDVVKVKGKVINYSNNTPEFASGKSYLLSQVRPATIAIENVASFEVGATDLTESDLDITTPSDGDITFVSGDDAVATIEANAIHAVALGTVTITANLAATENVDALNYAATSTTFSVTVVAPATKYAITFSGNGATGGDAPEFASEAAAGANITLPANTYTYTGHSFTGWKVYDENEDEVTVTAGAFTMPALPVTIKAQWEEISVWATTYTSNVTVGTDVVKFSDETEAPTYDAKKTGTGSNYGSTTVTVPYGTTKLHFHAVCYGADTYAVTLKVKNGESVLGTFNINKDAGAKGNSPFILENTPYLQYYSIALTNITEPTDITFEAESGSENGKRFILFGVNQEGGVLPVLDHIAISGDLTTKSGYKTGDDLDLDGLTVEAIYTLGGVPQTPIDITDKLGDGLTLTYDPLVVDQTEVTITASYEDKSDNIVITLDEAVVSGEPVILTDVSLRSWTSVNQYTTPATKTVTVTLKNVAAATATLADENDVFSIDKTNLVNGDIITISVINTETAGDFAATITISDNATENPAADKVVNLSLKVVAAEPQETPVSTTSEWVAATEIVDGMTVLITGVKSGVTYAMGAASSNGNNRTSVAGSLSEEIFTPGENTMPFTLVSTGAEDTYYIKTTTDKYLYNASSSGNSYLKTKAEQEDVSWTITLDNDGNAVITSVENTNRQLMRFNQNGSNNPLFNCYASNQQPVKLYVPYVAPTVYTVTFNTDGGSEIAAVDVEDGQTVAQPANPTKDDYNFVEWQLSGTAYDFATPVTGDITLDAVWEAITPAPTYETVRNGLTLNKYYTSCLARKVVAVKGATCWNMTQRNVAGTMAFLEEMTLPIEAGTPFIFQATADKFEVIYEGDVVTTAGSNGALRGTLVNMDQDAINDASNDNSNSDIYILSNNTLYKANGQEGNSIGANRAYIVYDELNIADVYVPALGRRYVTMQIGNVQTPTALEENAIEAENAKFILNGQLYILRDGKLYNAQGQLVK